MGNITELARLAGVNGRSWSDWACDDEVQNYLTDMPNAESEIPAWEKAYAQGCAAKRQAEGWVAVWTTAPSDYDTFGTMALEDCGAWRGKSLRKMLVEPRHVSYQSDRYCSGLHGAWLVDPRQEEREANERSERNRVAREREAAERLTGLAWLHALTESELNAAIESDDLETHGITYSDARAERTRRVTERATAEQLATWERCRASFTDGSVLVDDGSPGEKGVYGWIKGRDPHVYYQATVTNDWRRLASEATVDAMGEFVGSLEYVADWIASGRLRVVSAESVPPAAVTARIGQNRTITRVDVGGKIVWVGSATFAREPIVLDEKGHIVRAKSVRERALAESKS